MDVLTGVELKSFFVDKNTHALPGSIGYSI
jgi:hypothetical protein